MAACLLVVGFGPSAALAQDSDAVRIKKLEAEVANLKIMVATLQSLVHTAPGTALAPEGSGAAVPNDLEPRVRALDTQIRALTNQLEQLGQKVRALEAKLDAKLDAAPEPAAAAVLSNEVEALGKKVSALEAKLDAAPKAAPAPSYATPAPQAEAPKEAEPEGTETATSESAPIVPQAVAPVPEEPFDPTKPRWYGPRPGEAADAPQSISPPATTGALPQSFAARPNANAQALYQRGYGDFLQSDYPAAEKSFSKLVKTYPNDPLAGSAQYWVGETYYVRKQYKKAADTFLAGYRKYSGSDKAPDTLLRLGMSLAALGQNEAACSTFKELNDKFPDAPANIRDQAKGEAGKAGCVP